MFSIVIPVYNNAEFIPELIAELERVGRVVGDQFGMATEVVFVVDGSPDESHALLAARLPDAQFQSQLLLHSRNFGSFSAIRSGLGVARGQYFSVLAADLQESPDILLLFLDAMVNQHYDVAVGTRSHRDDPWMSRVLSSLFWSTYRRWIIRDIPKGGVDVFGCTQSFRDHLLRLEEANSSLVAQVYWLGFRRAEVGYVRHKRKYGRSAWSFRKRLNYMLDSIFAFTDLPVRLLTIVGGIGTLAALVLGITITILKFLGEIEVPGYAATVLTVVFFGALNMLGIGLVGSYAWRAFENTKSRPLGVIANTKLFVGRPNQPQRAPTMHEVAVDGRTS